MTNRPILGHEHTISFEVIMLSALVISMGASSTEAQVQPESQDIVARPRESLDTFHPSANDPFWVLTEGQRKEIKRAYSGALFDYDRKNWVMAIQSFDRLHAILPTGYNDSIERSKVAQRYLDEQIAAIKLAHANDPPRFSRGLTADDIEKKKQWLSRFKKESDHLAQAQQQVYIDQGPSAAPSPQSSTAGRTGGSPQAPEKFQPPAVYEAMLGEALTRLHAAGGEGVPGDFGRAIDPKATSAPQTVAGVSFANRGALNATVRHSLA